MEKNTCCTCFKPKATLTCGLCNESVCKYCAQFLQDEDFLYLPVKPAELQQDTFCGPCFDSQIAPKLEDYRATLKQAKDILIFTKNDNKETKYIKREEDPIEIPEASDREDLLMRLAFQAAGRGFNGLLDVDVISTKERNGTYQTTRWKGSGVPAHINPAKLVRDKSFSSKPN